MSGIKSHTPGPWHVQDHDGAYCMVRGAPTPGSNGQSIAKVWLQDTDFNDANARLIAQAPRMLGALKDAARTMKAMGAAEIENAMHPTYTSLVDLIKQIDGTEFYIERSKGRPE